MTKGRFNPETARPMGSKGGKARARKLTPQKRAEIARKAAQARWNRKRINFTPAPFEDWA